MKGPLKVGKGKKFVLDYMWSGSNDGRAFSRNYHATEVTVYLCGYNCSPAQAFYRVQSTVKARTAGEADKVARALVRELGLRDILAQLEDLAG